MPKNYSEYFKYAEEEGEALYKNEGAADGKFPPSDPWAMPNAIYLLLELYEVQRGINFGARIRELKTSIKRKIELIETNGENAFSITKSSIEELISIAGEKSLTPGGDYEHMLAALSFLLHKFVNNISPDAEDFIARKTDLSDLVIRVDSIKVGLMRGLDQAISLRAVFPFDYVPPAIPFLRYEQYLAIALNTEGSIEIQVRAIFREYVRGPRRSIGKEISWFISSLSKGEKALPEVIDEIKGTGLLARVAPGKEFQHALVAIYLLTMIHSYYEDEAQRQVDGHLAMSTTLAKTVNSSVGAIAVFIPERMDKVAPINETGWKTSDADIFVTIESEGPASAPASRLESGRDLSAGFAAPAAGAGAETAAAIAGAGTVAPSISLAPEKAGLRQDSRRKSGGITPLLKHGLLRQVSERAGFAAAPIRGAGAGAKASAALKR